MGAVLRILGWSPLTDSDITELRRHPKVVAVFSHTSPVDFFLYLLYYISENDMGHNYKVLVNYNFMSMWGWLVKPFGAISSPKITEKGGVEKITDVMKGEGDTYTLLISPKGTIKNCAWRTGYYHIAKNLGCVVMTIGLDYKEKKVVVNPAFSIESLSPSQVTKKAQGQMAHIYPRNPVFSEYPIFEHET